MKKTVLVTGSSRGIGKAIAKKFAQSGYNVIINCKQNFDALMALAEELQSLDILCLPVMADVSNYEQAKKMFDIIDDFTPTIDCIINNAGIDHVGLFTETTPEKWQELINTNLTSVYNICHFGVPRMLQQKKGNIINISSIWGIKGASMEVAYSATKSGLHGFTLALAKELGPSNIRVNAIACGAIETEMNSWLTDQEKNDFEEDISLCRFGKPEEVADLAYFLASDSSTYLTGEIIKLDGGII